jgi:AcrR family transcriptional regulator
MNLENNESTDAAGSVKAVEDPSQDHRTRVAAQRREKTRLRILQNSLALIGRKGLEGVSIDDFVLATGVSRGTLYNYFNTTNDLFLALTQALSEEVLTVVKPHVLSIEDPVRRFSVGTRLYMRMAVRYPVWGRFVTRVGTRIAMRGQHFDQYLFPDLASAMEREHLVGAPQAVLRDLVLGAIFYGIESQLDNPALEDHCERLVAALLRSIGMDSAKAEKVAFLPLPDVGPVQGPLFMTLPPSGAPDLASQAIIS